MAEILQVAENALNNGSGTISATFPNPVQEGSILLAFGNCGDLCLSVTSPTEGTFTSLHLVQYPTNDWGEVRVAWVRAGASASQTVTYPQDDGESAQNLVVLEIGGVPDDEWLDGSAVTAIITGGQDTFSVPMTSVTPTEADCLIIAALFAIQWGGGGGEAVEDIEFGNDFTTDVFSDTTGAWSTYLAVGHKQLSGGQGSPVAQTASATYDGDGEDNRIRGIMLAILPGGSSGPVELEVDDAASVTTIDGVTLVQHHVLATQDAASATAITEPTLTVTHVLDVDDAASVTTIEGVTLTQHHVLSVDDAASVTTADSVALAQAHHLVVDDAASATTAETPTLTQHHVLETQDAVSLTTISHLSLSGSTQLDTDDAASSTTITTPTLAQLHRLAVAEAVAVTAVETVTLVQHHVLVTQDAVAVTTIENVTLGGFGESATSVPTLAPAATSSGAVTAGRIAAAVVTAGRTSTSSVSDG